MKRSLAPFLLLAAPALAAANYCALPRASSAGTALATSRTYSALVSVNGPAGVTGGVGTTRISFGFVPANRAAYSCFLSTDTPLAVQALANAPATHRLVVSASRTMTLEWTPSFSALPVTYSVYLGTATSTLANIASGLVDTQQTVSNLEYTTLYYWQVIAADEFGRTSASPIYTFSIAPPTSHLIAAPNPFHPGNGTTTLLFEMQGAGWAELEIFSLPDERRVFRARLDGLQDGANTYTYDGRDNGGRLLVNGVFTIRLTTHGTNGSQTQLFKIISAR